MAPSSESWRRRREGQAMVESLVVLLVVCLVLFGFLQVSHAFAGREVMRHAAARAARARTVGFNSWMCEKVMLAAAIPASGKMLVPEDAPRDMALADDISRRPGSLWDWAVKAEPTSVRASYEENRIPSFLDCDNVERAEAVLNYEGWDDITASGLSGSAFDDNMIDVRIRKRQPLDVFVRMLNDWSGFAAGGADGLNELTLRGDFKIEGHYPLYLDDTER